MTNNMASLPNLPLSIPFDLDIQRQEEVTEKGGAGSGHHGHAGLAGVHGGSSPSKKGSGLSSIDPSVLKKYPSVKASGVNGVLFHGTVIDHLESIGSGGGLVPVRGDFVMEAYGEYADEEYANYEGELPVPEAVYFSGDHEFTGRGTAGEEAVKWVTLQVSRKLEGKGVRDVTIEDIREHGLLVIVSPEDMYYVHDLFLATENDSSLSLEWDDENGGWKTMYETPTEYISTEPGDFYSLSYVPASQLLYGDELVKYMELIKNPPKIAPVEPMVGGAPLSKYVGSLFDLSEYTNKEVRLFGTFKGGRGSGNWGHGGLPGVWGGSSPRKGGSRSDYRETARKMPWEMTRDEFENTPIYPKPDEGYQLIFHYTKSNEALDGIQEKGLLVSLGRSEGAGMLWGSDEPIADQKPVVAFQVPKDDIGIGDFHGKPISKHGSHYTIHRDIEPKDILGIYPYDFEFGKRTDTLRSWQFDPERGERDWWGSFVEFAIEDGLDVPSHVKEEWTSQTTKGGRGSGHWGHGGLAGVHGGSSPSKYRTAQLTREEAWDIHRDYGYHLVNINVTDDVMGVLDPEYEGEDARDAALAVEGKYGYKSEITQAVLMIESVLSPEDESVSTFVVYDEGENVVAGVSYTLDPYAEAVEVHFLGSLSRGAGLICLSHVFSLAAGKNYGITAHSIHGNKITDSMMERFGIERDISAINKYTPVDISTDGVKQIAKMLRRWNAMSQKGGRGSGNWGHGGLPGVHGGSSPTKSTGRDYNGVKITCEGSPYKKPFEMFGQVLNPDRMRLREKPLSDKHADMVAGWLDELPFAPEDFLENVVIIPKGDEVAFTPVPSSGYVKEVSYVENASIYQGAYNHYTNTLYVVSEIKDSPRFGDISKYGFRRALSLAVAQSKPDIVELWARKDRENPYYSYVPGGKDGSDAINFSKFFANYLAHKAGDRNVTGFDRFMTDQSPDVMDMDSFFKRATKEQSAFKGYMKAIVTDKLIEWQEKGGRGSGNWGHSGLAGIHGGSSVRGGYSGKVLSQSQAKEELDRYISGYRIAQVTGEYAHASSFITSSLENAKTGEVDAYAVYDKSNNIVAAISYRDVAEGLYVYTFGSTDRGAGILCLDHVFSQAAKENSAVIAHSAHIDRITDSLVKRFGINVSIGSQMVNVEVPAESVPEVSRLIKRFLKMGETTKGGKGSGNWGHGGLAGVHGGSSPKSPLELSYGGIPSVGGYDNWSEYEVGHQIFCEAAHCILGSLRKMKKGNPKEAEAGHITEELGLMRKAIAEYSRDIYTRDLEPERLPEIEKAGRELLKIVRDMKDRLGKPADEVERLALSTYDILHVFAFESRMNARIGDRNVFKNRRLKDHFADYEKEVEKFLSDSAFKGYIKSIVSDKLTEWQEKGGKGSGNWGHGGLAGVHGGSSPRSGGASTKPPTEADYFEVVNKMVEMHRSDTWQRHTVADYEWVVDEFVREHGSPPRRDVLRRPGVEDFISKYKDVVDIEHGLISWGDRDENPTYATSGKRYQITFSEDVMDFLFENKDAIVYHNHPNEEDFGLSGTLSTSDVISALNAGFGGIVAIYRKTNGKHVAGVFLNGKDKRVPRSEIASLQVFLNSLRSKLSNLWFPSHDRHMMINLQLARLTVMKLAYDFDSEYFEIPLSELSQKGGKGSGNWGHQGLPVVHGGSSTKRIGSTVAESNQYWQGTKADSIRRQLLEKVGQDDAHRVKLQKELNERQNRMFSEATSGSIDIGNYGRAKALQSFLADNSREDFDTLVDLVGQDKPLDAQVNIWEVQKPSGSKDDEKWLREYYDFNFSEYSTKEFFQIIPSSAISTSVGRIIEAKLEIGTGDTRFEPNKNRIVIDPSPGISFTSLSVVHEASHWLEFNSRGKDWMLKARDFRLRRTLGESPKAVTGLTGDRFLLDKFINPYIGRVYGSGAAGQYSTFTEINAMGLTYLFSDPVGFARQDPDYFNHTVSLLVGDK